MRQFINNVEAHSWQSICQSLLKDTLLSHTSEIRAFPGLTRHLQALYISTNRYYELRLLCADLPHTQYPIVAAIYLDNTTIVTQFNSDGTSIDAAYQLSIKDIHFSAGDYIVTTDGVTGIYWNAQYMSFGVASDNTVHKHLCGFTGLIRPATDYEIERLLSYQNNNEQSK